MKGCNWIMKLTPQAPVRCGRTPACSAAASFQWKDPKLMRLCEAHWPSAKRLPGLMSFEPMDDEEALVFDVMSR